MGPFGTGGISKSVCLGRGSSGVQAVPPRKARSSNSLVSLLRVSAEEVGGKRTDMEGMFGMVSYRISSRELEAKLQSN
jgi:hypothetical protein